MAAQTAERRPAAKAVAGKRKRRTPSEIRTRLLRAAKAEFNKKGFAGATTAAIAKRASVAEIQMFRYFPSKADLFREAIFAPLKDHFRAFNAKHAPDAIDQESIRERARLYAAELQAFLTDNAGLLISLFVTQNYGPSKAGDTARTRDDLQAFFDECADIMSRRAGHASGTDPGTIVRIAFGALLGCITFKDWLFPNAADESAIKEAMTDFVLAGIGPHSDVGIPKPHGQRRRSEQPISRRSR